jgi:hypothetical protein
MAAFWRSRPLAARAADSTIVGAFRVLKRLGAELRDGGSHRLHFLAGLGDPVG